MFTIQSNFINDFKTGDNINYNLRLLKLLYEHYAASGEPERSLLRKPITVTLVSITEAMLHDFLQRVQLNTREGIDLDPDVIKDIRYKHLKKLDHFIACVKKHRLFGDDETLYEQLDELRRLRNRVHIQSRDGRLEKNESQAFSVARKRRAENALEYVCRSLAMNFSRPVWAHGYVQDFEFPWEARYE